MVNDLSLLELSLAVAAVLDRPHRSLVPLRVLDGRDDRACRRRWKALDHDRRLRTFLLGALLGGVVTFGLLSVLGEAIHGAGGRLAYAVAAR